MEHTLCLEQLYDCLFQPLYTCTRTNLRVTYFGQTGGWSESSLIMTNESQNKIWSVWPITGFKIGYGGRTDRDGQTGTEKWLIGLSAEPEPKILCRSSYFWEHTTDCRRCDSRIWVITQPKRKEVHFHLGLWWLWLQSSFNAFFVWYHHYILCLLNLPRWSPNHLK